MLSSGVTGCGSVSDEVAKVVEYGLDIGVIRETFIGAGTLFGCNHVGK
jgi:hypothetical protein